MVRVDKPENVQDETNSELDINRHNRLNPSPVRIGIVREVLALVTRVGRVFNYTLYVICP